MMDLVLRSLLILSLALAGRLFLRSKDLSATERLARSLLPPALLTTVGVFAKFILLAPFWDRNASRLVGAFCFKLGLPLYPSPDSGAVQSMNYPPLAAILFWPATLFSTPTHALLAGALLTIFYFYAPVLCVFYYYGKHPPEKNSGSWISIFFLAFVMICLNTTSLSYSGFRLHADAPALGLGALACLFCSTGSLFASALCAASAIWTKQSLVPLLIALPFYVSIARGGKVALRYSVQLTSVLALFLLLTLTHVKAGDLLFNLIYISRKPWAGPIGNLLPLQWREMFLQHLLLPIMLFAFGRPAISFRDWRSWITNNPWTLWVIVAFAMTPVALMNRCTAGGDVNAFSLASYYLTIGAFVLLLSHWENRRIALCLVALLCVTELPALFHFGLAGILNGLPANPQEVAFNYARAHPGDAYFPWNPLSTLMAEGKLYHFEPAVTDWALAGHPLSEDHYNRYIPAAARIIAYPADNEFTHETTLKRLPQFNQRTDVQDLPGWMVYRREK